MFKSELKRVGLTKLFDLNLRVCFTVFKTKFALNNISARFSNFCNAGQSLV